MGVRILRGELQPGDSFPVEEEVANEAAVSRTVVREAIKVLAAKRLVESRPKTGTRVLPRREWNLLDPDVLAWQVEAGPDRRFLEEALEVRRLIEPQVARLAAERATEVEVAALEEAHAAMEAAGESMEAFSEPDLRFHRLLFESTHNELLEQMASILTLVLQTIFSYSNQPPRALPRATRLHGAVVDAVRAHDGPAAERAMVRLSKDTARNVDRVLQREPSGRRP